MCYQIIFSEIIFLEVVKMNHTQILKKMKKINKNRLPVIMTLLVIVFSLFNISSIALDNPITTLGNGSSEEIITFPFGGGYNNDLNLTLPEGVIITSAEMELRGLGITGVLSKYKHDFSDTVNNAAWGGITTENPPKSNPSTFTTNLFSNTDYTNVKSSNDIRATYTAKGVNNYPYHLFRFKITETGITTLNAYWEGYGYFNGFMISPYWAYLYIWNSSSNSWEHIGTNSSMVHPVDFVIRSSSYTNPNDYIDSSNELYLMAQGPGVVDGNFSSDINTDYTRINTVGLGVSFPADPTLNIGDDDDIEWEFSGIFDQNIIIDDNENFKGELQSIIDSAEPGCKFVDIPLRFSSSTQGKIKISNISISYEYPEINLPPQLVSNIPNGTLGFYEDTNGGDNLINLNDYFWDDRDNGSLMFSIIKNNNKIQAEMDADGFHLDFYSEPDYFGVCEFQLKATDKGLDGMVGIDVDLFSNSNIFTVAVWPTNDAPVIDSIGGITIPKYQTELSFKGAEGAFEDEWFNKSITCHDIDGDTLSYNLNLTLPPPARITLISDPINNNFVNLSIYATNDYVGMLRINLTITDNNESSNSKPGNPSSGPLIDYLELIIEVRNVNDKPSLFPIGDMICDEDQWFNFTLNATDDDLIHGDKVWFSTNITTAIPNLVQNKNYAFNGYTGYFAILPNNEMVGEYWVKFAATDIDGAGDSENVKLIIKNVNDPPIPVISSPIEGVKYNTSSLISFDGSESNDDDWIHGDRLEFQWSSNISGFLGSGPKLLRNLTDPGWHEITLKVTDNSNTVVQDTVLIRVTEFKSPIDDKNGDKDDSDGTGKKEGNEYFGLSLLIIVIVVIIGIMIFIRHRKKSKDESKVGSDNELSRVPPDSGPSLPLTAPQPPFQQLPVAQPIMPIPIQPQFQYYYPPPMQPFLQPPISQQIAQPVAQQLIQPPVAQIITEPPTQENSQNTPNIPRNNENQS